MNNDSTRDASITNFMKLNVPVFQQSCLEIGLDVGVNKFEIMPSIFPHYGTFCFSPKC